MESIEIPLEKPIKRGETEITKITIRKPDPGAMRGCSLRALLDTDVDNIVRVLPRISDPALIPAEINKIDPADLLEIGGAIANFLLPRRVLAALTPEQDSPTT